MAFVGGCVTRVVVLVELFAGVAEDFLVALPPTVEAVTAPAVVEVLSTVVEESPGAAVVVVSSLPVPGAALLLFLEPPPPHAAASNAALVHTAKTRTSFEADPMLMVSPSSSASSFKSKTSILWNDRNRDRKYDFTNTLVAR
jgi:hypothetical protein